MKQYKEKTEKQYKNFDTSSDTSFDTSVFEHENGKKKMLLELMYDKNYRPMKLKELCVLLEVPRERRYELETALNQLVDEGKIGISAHGKYGKPELFTLKGSFTSTNRGFGFVTVEGKENDIFIAPDNTLGALPGDVVLVSVISHSNGSRREEGRIVRILEHTLTSVVGTFQKNKNFGFVLPDNQRIPRDFFVEKGKDMDAKNGDKVVATILDYGSVHKNPQVEITEILGAKNEPGTDILSIVRSYGIPEEFPQEVLDSLDSIPDEVTEEEKVGRRDIRSLHTVTIDGEDARDLDDAISLTFENGIYHLGVHIADVTHYVKEGSLLDEEAVKRGTSVYLTDRVIPMLPRKLSNGICSLNAGTDRLALSCFMDIDENGTMINHEICETLIHVDRRMTYTMVASLLDGMESPEEYKDFVADFKLMKQLSDLLRDKRFGRGAIDFDFPESKIILDEKGRPVEIKAYERSAATRLIEDFMLLTNETIAEEYYWLELPFVYRIHENPDEEKLRAFATFINNFGYSLHLTNHTKELQKLLSRIEGSDAEGLISRILLRSMKQAKYSPENLGHFGLSAKYYCHFTSPIRRYPDLQIHRIIKEQLHGELNEARQEHYDHILPGVCDSSSKLERRADEAERETDKLKKAQYMRRHIGDVYEGVISGVTAYGFYVELENTVEGLVRAANLDDDYYIYDQEHYQMVGEMTGRTFRIGQTVSVVVVDADTLTKQIEFLLYYPEEYWLKGETRHGKRKPKTHRK
jgi:ribonuclease R